ncbi:hypothetical protein HK104_002177 [Borealophlyctis nickersoniae]|nr:hypothetical protein HK104_002177 [Borealophlyctis nickersoniae]
MPTDTPVTKAIESLTMETTEQPLPLDEAVRSLASTQRIVTVRPHPNAHSLDLATVLGWTVVIKKGEFAEGDLVVYVEIDSVVPSDAEWAAFLAARNFRVASVRLRGELSQGLCLPLSVLPDAEKGKVVEGDDVTRVLGITKYVPPPQKVKGGGGGNGYILGDFPTHLISKTDEPRIQSYPKLLNELKGLPYYAAIKYDGSSMTCLIHPDTGEFMVCSRNNIRGLPPTVTPSSLDSLPPKTRLDDFWTAVKSYNLIPTLTRTPHLAIQAEIYGPAIQRNPLGASHIRLAVFNIYDLKRRRYLDYDDMKRACTDMELPMVQVVDEGEAFDMDVPALLQLAKGVYDGTRNPREGIVVRPKREKWTGLYSRVRRLSFKAINNDFLLKGGT